MPGPGSIPLSMTVLRKTVATSLEDFLCHFFFFLKTLFILGQIYFY